MKHLLLFLPRHFLFWMCLLPLAMTACLDENVSCVTDTFDTARVEFLKLDRSNARNDTLYIASILASNGAYLDVQDTALRRVSLPLDPSGNQVTFYVNWKEDSAAELQTDTLVLAYELEQKLVSPECGVEQRYVNLRSINPAFDSLLVVEPDINLFTNPNIRIYTCQYEYTNLARARFYRIDTTSTDPVVTTNVLDTLIFTSITDDLGNVILEESDTLDRIRLPVDTNRNNTTFFFEIENDEGEIVSRSLNVSYFVDTVQIFDCLPQTRVNSLDVDSDDYDFQDVEVNTEELNINNNLNLEIFF
ncbi:hypothetical protein OKW21_006005 [Catalinimonas alkaloidigena]|uniref:DUF6452 family protein n=1 Tax=Catalinimonas alkaloidigena TaxID=1075417 RepID=UPI0024065658|nr:DUF6452 family protein [Catalinimonas alkaloidigena]MDF9800742.1 hypothetical protein [Catalinimonas alkaloidigena]